MTTIKLKDPVKAKKETPIYYAGQFFKLTLSRGFLIALLAEVTDGMMLFIIEKDKINRWNSEIYNKDGVTLDELIEQGNLQGKDLSPISVTISED